MDKLKNKLILRTNTKTGKRVKKKKGTKKREKYHVSDKQKKKKKGDKSTTIASYGTAV